MEESGSISRQQRIEVVIERLEKIKQNQSKLFGNSSLDAQFKLSELAQITSVLDYQLEFEKLCCKAEETHELILISLFISGLKPEIRWELQLNRPFSLKEAFISARFHESRLEGLKVVMNKVDDELASSELEIETVKVDDELPRSDIAHKFDRKMGMNITNLMQFEDIEEEKLVPLDAELLVETPLLIHSFENITPTTDEFGNEGKLAKSPLVITCINEDEVRLVVECSTRVANSSSMIRRRMNLKLYALKEVYKESSSLHLEDKVVLKDGRVDTTMEDVV